jgi:hypothetical protein
MVSGSRREFVVREEERRSKTQPTPILCLPKNSEIENYQEVNMKFASKIPVLISLLAGVLFLLPHDTRAQFTAGDLVVLRVGDGSGALGNAATPDFLDEYTTTGTFVKTIAIDASTTGSRLTNSGSASSEGFVHRSVNGRYLTFGGYDAASGTTSIASSSPGTVNRVVARVDALGNIDYSTKFNNGYSNNIRSAATSDGSAFWAVPATSSVMYLPYGNSGAGTQLSETDTNVRVVNIFNGQLYASSSAAGAFGIYTVGTGLPTTSGQTTAQLNGFPTSGLSSYDYSISSDTNTIYLADDRSIASGGGVQKWTLSGGTWSNVYTLNSGLSKGVRGLTVDWSGTNPVIYVTDAASSTNKLCVVTDAGSSSSFTTLATAATNKIFRGVAFAPYSTITFTDGTLYHAPNGTPNTNDNAIGRFQLAGNINGGKLTSVTVNLTGIFTGLTTLKLYASPSATFSVGSSTQLASATPGSTATFTISGGHLIPTSPGEYYYVVADLDNSASGSATVSIADQSKLSFANAAIYTGFSSASLSTHDVPLPVTVKGITAKVDAGKIYLNISTATEIDVAGFNISRSLSKDGWFDLISSYASNPALKASGSVTSGGSYSFVDSKISAGQTYYYKVESVGKSGASQQVGEILKVQVLLPKAYAVYQNYPNPFNPTTSIRFDLKADAKVMVDVYNLLGMKVKSLNNGTMSAGTHEVPVDMSKMPSGVYYYRFTAVDNTGNAFVQTQRMVLVK